MSMSDSELTGFKNIEEPLAPWEQPKKAVKRVAEPVKEVVEDVVEQVENSINIEYKSEPVEEAVAEAEQPAKEETIQEQAAEEEFMFDDADFDPNEHEWMYDDAECDTYDADTNSFGNEFVGNCIPNHDPELAKEAEMLCRWAAARAGVVVITPMAGAIALLSNEVYMIMRLSRLYGVTMSEGAAAGILSSLGATFIGQTLATLIPFPPLQMPIAISVTYGTGKAVTAWLQAGCPSGIEEFKEVFNRARNASAENVDFFENMSCRHKPLGDEKKDFSDKVVDAVGSGADYTSNKFTEWFGILGEAAKEKVAELKAEHDAKVAEEKALHPEEKGFVEEVKEGYDGTVADIKQAVTDLVDAFKNDVQEVVGKKEESSPKEEIPEEKSEK